MVRKDPFGKNRESAFHSSSYSEGCYPQCRDSNYQPLYSNRMCKGSGDINIIKTNNNFLKIIPSES